MGSRLRSQNRLIYSVNDCVKKRGLNVGRTRMLSMVYGRNEWREFSKRKCLGHSPGDDPLTWTRSYSSWLCQLYERKDSSQYTPVVE